MGDPSRLTADQVAQESVEALRHREFDRMTSAAAVPTRLSSPGVPSSVTAAAAMAGATSRLAPSSTPVALRSVRRISISARTSWAWL